MVRRENYYSLIVASAILSIAILVTFEIYQLREPTRLVEDASQDQEFARASGAELFQSNCASCHGKDGEGVIGPRLNSKSLLETVTDDHFFSLIRSGVPGTGMPAWGQLFGGPLTDEQVRQVVTYIRSWAPGVEISEAEEGTQADPAQGAEIFESICSFCHGNQGLGTERAPALNDPALLNSFNDSWFRETISKGRPSKGMPTWGTVLSPDQIDSVVALLAEWRMGTPVESPPSVEPSDAPGAVVFAEKCAVCHGEDGSGGLGPSLRDNTFIMGLDDQALSEFVLSGRSGTQMAGFEGRLSDIELDTLIEFLRHWQSN